MKLTEIDLKGAGEFCEAPATFQCTRYHLPGPWDYVYTNGEVLLRVRQDGSGYLQIAPPNGAPLLGGPPLLHREGGHAAPMMFTWIVPEKSGRREAFSNFYLPALPVPDPAVEPDEYTCTFAPEAARYRLVRSGWLVETELWVPPAGAAAVMTVSLVNTRPKRRGCTLIPVVKPHMGPFSFGVWDVAYWYQRSALGRLGEFPAFWLETRDPEGVPANRLRAAVISDFKASSFEVASDRFVGSGQWSSPQAVWRGRLAMSLRGRKLPPFGKATPANASVGQSPIAALAGKVSLRPGEKYEFTVVFGKLPETSDGRVPPRSELRKLARYLAPAARRRALAKLRKRYDDLFAHRKLETPDKCLSRYANEFLPLQAYWVGLLDRGWPSGHRGTRDAAQDATCTVPIDAGPARERLVEIFSNQRSDGYFPRSYSPTGRRNIPKADGHVDAGAWVWEFLWKYICYTRDFDVLKQRTGWLDQRGKATVLDHAIALLGYYVAAKNLGPHGLCKIRGGDWNDAINNAGLEGRGETVMVSCQVVLCLEQAVELLKHLSAGGGPGGLAGAARRFSAAAGRLRRNLLAHARNRMGYFNGVFTDEGRWAFSPKDPDGRRRVNGPANSFAVIAGIVRGRQRDKVFDALDGLKGPHGWRLFYPPIGEPPIEKLGRLGHGDLAPGIAENGTPYNHGSHGFLGRAAWTAGRGNLLGETLRYMLPYDQKAHPVNVARTAPYAVANHWKEAIGLEGVGGDTFLTGSISTALRNCYEGLAGFRPDLHDLVIDPCIPAAWDGLVAEMDFLSGRYRLVVRNPQHVECGVVELLLNGEPAGRSLYNPRLGRRVAAIPIADLKGGEDCTIEARLGVAEP